MAFDPQKEVFEVSGEKCPQLEGYVCMTPRAWGELINADIDREQAHKAELVQFETQAKLAEAQRKAAMEALEHAQFWQRWGPIIVLTVGGIAATVGAAGGALIEKAMRP